MGEPIRLKRLNREPILAPGGISRLLILLALLASANLVWRAVHWAGDRALVSAGLPRKRELAPPEVREAAAECILTKRSLDCPKVLEWEARQ
jgi:hypothetical protein